MLMTNHKKKGEKTKQEKLSKLLETPCANPPPWDTSPLGPQHEGFLISV